MRVTHALCFFFAGSAGLPAQVASPPYDLRQQTLDYLKSTFSVGSLAAAVGFGGESALLNGTSEFGRGFECYSNHMEANLARHVIERSLEFGLAAPFRQDETVATSRDQRFRERMKAALYHSFFVAGRNGDEFAFPRFGAAIGAAWITHEWHPWRSTRTDPWLDGSKLLSAYVGRSFWHEFRPDIKKGLRTGRRKLFRQTAEQPLLAVSDATTCSVHCK